MNSLILSTRPAQGRFVQSLAEMCGIFNSIPGEKTYWDFSKTNVGVNYINQHAKTKFKFSNKLSDFYFNDVVKMASWREAINKTDVSCFKQFDQIFILGGMLSTQSGLKRNNKKYDDLIDTKNQINFISVGCQLHKIFTTLKINTEYKTPIHEFCYDTQETNINQSIFAPYDYNLYHGYDIPRYGMKRLDALQYFNLQNKTIFDDFSNKPLDFTFGMTIITKDRLYQEAYAKEVLHHFPKHKFFIYNKITEEDNFVDRNTYLNLIGKSKYTLILPTYDETAISIFRIIESLERECLPLFHCSCATEEFCASFKIDQTVIDKLKIDGNKFILQDDERRDIISYLNKKILPYQKGFNI